MEKAQPFGDRSKTFWHGVNAIVDIQKSSEIDTENYSVSAAPKQKLTVEEIETVRMHAIVYLHSISSKISKLIALIFIFV